VAARAGDLLKQLVVVERDKPGTTDPVPKESFVTHVGNQGCGVGYYK